MNNLLKKINFSGGEFIGFLLFAFGAYYIEGYLKFICIPPALACLFALINNLKREKSEIIKLLFYLFGSLCAGSVGVAIFDSYWNNNAILIAKIGFLAFVGFFFLASIIGVIISIYLIINYLRKRKR